MPKMKAKKATAKGASLTPVGLALNYVARLEQQGRRIARYSGAWWERLNDRWAELPQEHLAHDVLLSINNKGGKGTRGELADVLNQLAAHVALDVKEAMPFWYDAEDGVPKKRRLIAVQNGLIDLDEAEKTGNLKVQPHDERWFSANVLPFAYHGDLGCYHWKVGLNTLLPWQDSGDRRQQVLQEMFGYVLFCPDQRYKKWFLLYGTGDDGKSQVLTILNRLVGTENVSHTPLDRFGKQFGLQDMVGKLLNSCADLPDIEKLDTSKLKQITGGDPVQAERKHTSSVLLHPGLKLAFSTNKLPGTTDKSEGFWVRPLVVPFKDPVPEEEQIKNWADVLEYELPYIFAWAWYGWLHLKSRDGFSKCKLCAKLLAEHRERSDSVRWFLKERCVLGPDRTITRKELLDAYLKLCKDHNLNPLNAPNLTEEMRKHAKEHLIGPKECRVRGWKGVSLRPGAA